MTWLQAIVAILVAMISGVGGSYFSYRQFIIKHKDELEQKSIQKQIDDSIDKAMGRFIAECGAIGDAQIEKAKDEVRSEFQEGLEMRGAEGKERFDINSKQIADNSTMIKEILSIQKEQAEKFTQMADAVANLAQVNEACAESQRNSNYDRLLIVTNKIIKSGKMTITEKTNLKQLYDSWRKLKGYDPKIDTMYEECLKIKPTLDGE